VKTQSEIKKIKTACDITLEILDRLPQLLKRHKTERRLADALCRAARDNDCGLAYPPIVASGPHSGVPHHWPQEKRIRHNRILLIDFGVRYNGYCADLTRTYFLGRPSDQLKWEYWAVGQAKQKAFEAAKAGTNAHELYAIANNFLKKSIRQEIPHALGHGIGLQVHDYPTRLAIDEKWTLQDGQCLTLEPAFYTKKYGIRIEDDFYIQNGSAKWFTGAPDELLRP
ncbi:MAG: Xaa-Pro peptidase family protein, partial [Candidatus Diapherotrites archaeon]|nr:Xaa-Pro peptidase family protein [Candidatus Diapherotrites archaeon]